MRLSEQESRWKWQDAVALHSGLRQEHRLATIDTIIELLNATMLWPNTANSAHEAFAVLLEEVDELKEHVWANKKRRDLVKMRAEAIQVAAMAIRFAAEVCSEERGRR